MTGETEQVRLEMASATPAQLSYSLDNPGAADTIFVSADPADNALSLILSASAVSGFAPGVLVPPADAPGGSGSLLYFDLSPLGLSDAEYSAIELTAAGWDAQRFDGQVIGFTPTAAVSLAPAPASIAFALQGFAMAQAPGSSASLSVLAYRVSGVTSGSFPVSGNITVIFQLPDNDTGNLATAMQVSMTPTQVISSIDGCPEVQNRLMLTMTQNPAAPIVTAGVDTAFSLNFVYADDANGYGALLTVAEGKALEITAGPGATGWTITPNLNADPPFWTLTPPANTPLFGGGAQSTIAFDIANLVTRFQPGPTVALIGYSDVPGYKNGSFAVTLIKQPHVTIGSFAVSPQQLALNEDATAPVEVTWTTSFATELTLLVNGQQIDVTNRTSYPLALRDSANIQLLAQGPTPGGGDNRALSAIVPVQVFPLIKSFVFQSALTNTGSSDLVIGLAWEVVTNAPSVDIVCGTARGSYPAKGSQSFSSQPPFSMSLSASAGLNGPTVTQSLTPLPSNCWAAAAFDVPETQFMTGVQFEGIPQTTITVTIDLPPAQPIVSTQTWPGTNPNGLLGWNCVGQVGSPAMVTACTNPYPPGGSAAIFLVVPAN